MVEHHISMLDTYFRVVAAASKLGQNMIITRSLAFKTVLQHFLAIKIVIVVNNMRNSHFICSNFKVNDVTRDIVLF